MCTWCVGAVFFSFPLLVLIYFCFLASAVSCHAMNSHNCMMLVSYYIIHTGG